MNSIIQTFKKLVVQIATPYSKGTGFFLRDYGLIVTNEHVVRDNRQVVIHGSELDKQLVEVVFLDQTFDLAFLKLPHQPDLPQAILSKTEKLKTGDKVLAVGHPFGGSFESKEGEVTDIDDDGENISYIHHNATLSSGNSGGPLICNNGTVVGINTFIASEENGTGFSLPMKYLKQALFEFEAGKGKSASRCFACAKIVFENASNHKNCIHCGASIQLPSQIQPYESHGVANTIETLLAGSGYDPELSRSGHLQWEIQQGSAKINISYYDKTGLIIGDAYLCKLPSEKQVPLYEFLLRQNYEIEGLAFSIRGHAIVLSLLINDSYLNVETGEVLLNHLFERADFYDNILVEKFGASWGIKEN